MRQKLFLFSQGRQGTFVLAYVLYVTILRAVKVGKGKMNDITIFSYLNSFCTKIANMEIPIILGDHSQGMKIHMRYAFIIMDNDIPQKQKFQKFKIDKNKTKASCLKYRFAQDIRNFFSRCKMLNSLRTIQIPFKTCANLSWQFGFKIKSQSSHFSQTFTMKSYDRHNATIVTTERARTRVRLTTHNTL